LRQTVPHECAHLIARTIFGVHIKPHGNEWKTVMVQLGANPKRCHSYDTSNSTVYQKSKFVYECRCQKHVVGPTRHKKMLKGLRYTCRNCRSILTFVKSCGKVSVNDAIKMI
jgi:SprT protein